MTMNKSNKKRVSLSVVLLSIVYPLIAVAYYVENVMFDSSEAISSNRFGIKNIERTRRSVVSIFAEYGAYYTRRAYRMDSDTFWHLHKLLQPSKRGRAPNCDIPSELKLSLAIRYFAGGDPYDLMISHGVSLSSVYNSVWQVVDAVNACEDLVIEFPTDHEAQKDIAEGFKKNLKLASILVLAQSTVCWCG